MNFFKSKDKPYYLNLEEILNKLYEASPEYDRLAQANRARLRKVTSRESEVLEVGRMIALRDSFDPDAPMSSRKSVLSLMLETDGTLMPTNMCIDPYFRRPMLGSFEDEVSSSTEPDLIETGRGLR